MASLLIAEHAIAADNASTALVNSTKAPTPVS
jgi:hypothetical protein